jgi:AcrR family transcriptional regulator
MSNQPVLNVKISDGRFARSQKTKDAIVKALLKLLNDTPFPTAEQVARESKIGLRTVYRQFKDMESIYLSYMKSACLH